MPVVMRLRVVSLPAFCNSMKNRSICICVSVSPSTSAVMQHAHEVVARLGPALLAEPVGVHVHRGRRPRPARRASRTRRSRTSARSSRNTCSRSSSGTPTRSAITCNGSHSAMSVTRSHSSGPASDADDAIDAVADPVLELGDAPRREALVDQLAQLRVQRRVLADEQLRHRGVVFGHLGVDERIAARC